MNQNLNLYQIFNEVAKAGNISKASKVLYISQPAISKAISKLENSLNCSLFVRTSRGVSLTPDGEILYAQVQTALDALKLGEEKIKMANELGIGQITIGASTTICKYVLFPYLKEFTSNNPHVKVSIFCHNSLETIEALEQGKIDIGIVRYPSSRNSLSYNPLLSIHDTFIATQNYLDNFSKREELTKEKIIESATFMMLNKENITRKYVEAALSASGYNLQNIIEMTNMDLLIDFAKIDLGISCVIKEFVEEEIKSGIFKEVDLLGEMPSRQIGLAYLPSKLESNPSAMFFLESCLKKSSQFE